MISRPTYQKHRSRFTWFLSLLLTTVAFGIFRWLDPHPIFPYSLDMMSEKTFTQRASALFDVTGNGQSEIIQFASYNNFPAIEIYSYDDVYMDTYRLSGEWLGDYVDYYVADIDGDGFGEIYTFTRQNDSILLNAMEPYGDDGHFQKDVFVNVTQKVNDKYDLQIPFIKAIDVTGDGSKELVFIISAGYSLFPRKLYVYSPNTGELLQTQATGARFHHVAPFENDTGENLFLVSSYSSENFKGKNNVPYPDTSGWLFGYTAGLDSLFLEIEFAEGKSFVHVFPYKADYEWLLYVIVYHQYTNTNELHLYNLKGELLKRQEVEFNYNLFFLNNYYPEFDFLGLQGLNTTLLFDHSLQPIKMRNPINEFAIYNRGFKGSSLENLIFARIDDGFIVTNKSLSILGRMEINGFNNPFSFKVSLVDSLSKNQYLLGLYNENGKLYLIKINSNPIYPFRYMLAGSVFLVFFLFFHGIIMLQNHFIRKKMDTEMRLASLQIQSVQNQLHPHFTFNVLNNIAALIHKGDNEVGYRYLNGFSDMLRVVLNHSGSDKWQLSDELHFIDSYLSMENLRFNDKFKKEIECKDKSLLNFSVPKLMIQTFVENSIRHGLVHKSGDCLLKVSISDNEKSIRVEVEDNGIGREKSAMLARKGTGKGLYILQEFMEVWNRLHIDPFSMEIHDLVDPNGLPAGTLVVVNIPKAYTS